MENKVQILNNENYIKNWFLDRNEYMDNREDKEEYLDLLVFYTIVFERLAGISKEDSIIVEDGKVQIVSGPAVTGEEAEWILKNVNFAFGYVGVAEAKLWDGWRYVKYLSGVLTQVDLEDNYQDWYERTMRSYGAVYLERTVYVIKDKVFYADQPLTEEEIEYIRRNERGEQTQYSLDHDEYGLCWW